MEISTKHLKMINIALTTHIDWLESETDNAPIPKEQHLAELHAYEELHEQIEVLLMQQ